MLIPVFAWPANLVDYWTPGPDQSHLAFPRIENKFLCGSRLIFRGHTKRPPAVLWIFLGRRDLARVCLKDLNFQDRLCGYRSMSRQSGIALQERLIAPIVKRTGMTRQDVHKLLLEDHHIGAEEALDRGLVDRIVSNC